MKLYHLLIGLLGVVALIRAYFLHNYLRILRNQKKDSIISFFNSPDRDVKFLVIYPLSPTLPEEGKKKYYINSLTYFIYILIIILVLSLIFSE